MAYGGCYDLTQNARFNQRVTMAIVEAAVAIYNEDPAVAGHAERSALAILALKSPESYSKSFVFAVSSQQTETDETLISDADIYTAISSAWNALSGV